MARRSALTIIEGFYVAQIVFHFYRKGVLHSLTIFRTPGQVAMEFEFDEDATTALLEFLHYSTDLLQRNGKRQYRLAPKYKPYGALAFHLDKFLGAYGGPLANLGIALRPPRLGCQLVDRRELAVAFSRLEPGREGETAAVIRTAGVKSLLDLGCGAADLLKELCGADPAFRGWAVDADSDMCAAAAASVAAAGLASRIKVIQADVRKLRDVLPPNERRQVGALFGRSILNELCRANGAPLVEFLAELKRLFPHRTFFVSDYYGKLTHAATVSARHRHTLLQDVAQVLSGQGVPSPDLAAWAALYQAAGCRVVEAYEGEATGIAWFLHVVRL